MSRYLIASVAVDKALYHMDKAYDYLVPSSFCDTIQPGCRVVVPFGRANRHLGGIVLSLFESHEKNGLKAVVSIIDNKPVFSDEMLQMAQWIKERNFCPLFDVFRAMLPAGLSNKIIASYKLSENINEERINCLTGDKKIIAQFLLQHGETSEDKLSALGLEDAHKELRKMYSDGCVLINNISKQQTGDAGIKMVGIAGEDTGIKLTEKQRRVYEFISDAGDCAIKEACYYCGVTSIVVTGLCKKGLLHEYDQEVFRRPYEVFESGSADIINLTPKQCTAYNSLLCKYKETNSATALLYGITGSGKTSVFLKLVDKCVDDGKGVIVMVPEIALTPQTLSIFHKRYGNKVAVFHSAMSGGQRMDEWKRVKSGEALIAVGTRSAAFAPFENIGLIIMDEEQESSYKSEKNPKYHARDVARFRSGYHKSLLLLASATPSIESFSAAASGRYTLVTIDERYGNAILPQVMTVDMRREIMGGNINCISKPLFDSLNSTLESNNQAILLLNRRGHNTFVSCPSCGHVMTCPNCSISMTYHSANNRLMCHYCSESENYINSCPKCGSEHMRYMGLGTQKAQTELQSLFPKARILRMDADSTLKRGAYEKNLNAFKNGDYDIMLGTQMVAKGLDFKRVTLVGVINADQSLYSDDFRSYERTFSLLTQVVGRSGRGEQRGTAIIQTIDPDNRIIGLASNQDYESFYNDEIMTRKIMVYPPYCDIAVIWVTAADSELALSAANEVAKGIKGYLKTNEFEDVKLVLLGPSVAAVPKINNKYRFRIIIKCKNNNKTRQLLSRMTIEFAKRYQSSNVALSLDINPTNIL